MIHILIPFRANRLIYYFYLITINNNTDVGRISGHEHAALLCSCHAKSLFFVLILIAVTSEQFDLAMRVSFEHKSLLRRTHGHAINLSYKPLQSDTCISLSACMKSWYSD